MPQQRTGQRNGHTRQRPASKQAKSTSRGKPRRGNGASKPKAAAKAPVKPAKSAKKVASKTGKAVAKSTPGSAPKRLALKLAGKAAKKMAASAAEHAGGGLRSLTELAAEGTGEAVKKTRVKLTRRRLPIQRSIDIAVPLKLAWEEWTALEFLPEGAHAVSDIEREGAELSGRTTGPRQRDWSAEILDERAEQSFAWQSYEGSDCAGLITFHRLSERLTRVELNLDVVPSSPAEAAALVTRLADHRAETELRRWKARLELINPDLYEDEEDEPDEADEDDPDATEAPDGAEDAEDAMTDRDPDEQD